MSSAVNVAGDERVQGWLQEQLAVYMHQVDPAQAQHVLGGALRLNPKVLRPLEGVAYRRLSPAIDQAQAAARYLADQYREPNALLLGVNALLDELVLDPDRTDEFEDAAEGIALHLGFTAQRPERDTGNGPDVLWAVGDGRYLVIECKSGATADRIWRRDVAQLAHSMNWFAEAYDNTFSPTPVLIHRTARLEHNATAPNGTRVMTDVKLGLLRDAVRAFTVALATSGAWSEVDEVVRQLRQHHLIGPDLTGSYTMRPRPA